MPKRGEGERGRVVKRGADCRGWEVAETSIGPAIACHTPLLGVKMPYPLRGTKLHETTLCRSLRTCPNPL